ncbi:MAG: penicillin-binding protein 2, partial [Phycisphaerae bacterium]|nr:penicillin-binding protein 2 [Phycisphaerae bacterium]
LSGSHDLRRVKADARRRPLWVESARDEGEVGSSIADLNRDGRTIVLTIDKAIQSFVEIELKRVIEKYEAKGVIGIVMDPRTGEVLAMANLPAYDPNNYGDYPAEARRNRAITDPYEPGSTFKAFVAAAALAKGVVKMEEQIHCGNGVWRYRSRTINDHHPYGRLSLQDIVVKSSNVGMAKLGVRLGDERLRQAVLDFGFGSKTGILLSGENAGVVQSAQKWSYWTTTSVPFGHEIMVTPLQLVTAFSVFANGGKLLKPRIVRGILDTRGRLVADLAGKPEVVSQVMPEPLANAFRDEVLVEVVERGTGRQCKISGYKVFGKTGTAQKLAPPGSAESGNGYSHELYVGSFIAGAPAEAPRLVVLVAVDEPNKSKGYYGGTVAAPAVRAILEQTLAYLGVRPQGAVAGSRRPSWDPQTRLASDGSTR